MTHEQTHQLIIEAAKEDMLDLGRRINRIFSKEEERKRKHIAHVTRLHEEWGEKPYDPEEDAEKSKQYFLKCFRLKDEHLARLLYERLSQVVLPKIRLALDDVEVRIEGRTTTNTFIAKNVYQVLHRRKMYVEACSPGLLGEYKKVVHEGLVKRTSRDILTSDCDLNMREGNALYAIRHIEPLISDLSEENIENIRRTMRSFRPRFNGIRCNPDNELLSAKSRAKYDRAHEIYFAKVRAIDQQLGIVV